MDQPFSYLYDAWNQGETSRFSEFFAEDAIYETSGLFPGFAPTYRGPEGMRRFYETMLEAWESFQIEVVETIEDEDALITRVQFTGRGKTSGVEVDLEFAHGFHFDGEQVTHLVSRGSVEEVRARIAELRAGGEWPA